MFKLIVLLFLPLIVFSQNVWEMTEWRADGVFETLECIDSNNCFLVSRATGAIHKTTNKGETWEFLFDNHLNYKDFDNEVICEGACDWLLDLNEHYFGREVLINNDDNNHNMKENNEFKLKLNLTYQNNQVKLLIDSQVESNNLNIAISSLEGKQLKSLKADLNLGFNEYVIDYNEISSGLYLVSISLDGYLLKTEKIVKVK